MIRKPHKTPKLDTDNELSLMSRRLSCNVISSKKKQRAISFFNPDIDNESNAYAEVASPTKSKDSSRIELRNESKVAKNLESPKAEQSPTKNMCIDTQDFDEVYDSSCFDSFNVQSTYHHYMDPKDPRRVRKESGEASMDAAKKSKRKVNKKDAFNTIKTPNDLQSLSEKDHMFYTSARAGQFGKHLEDNFGTFSTSQLPQQTEMNYLVEILTNPQAKLDKNVIVRHHNGDLCSNIRNCVKLDRTGIVISEKCLSKNIVDNFGVTGHHIKWLKPSKTSSETKYPACVSFPDGKQVFSKEFDPLNLPENVETVMYSRSKDPVKVENEYNEGDLPHPSIISKQFNSPLNLVKRKVSKDTTNNPSFRSKISTDRNLYQSRYNDNEAVNPVKQMKNHRSRLNSEYEPEDYAEIIPVKDLDTEVKKVQMKEKPNTPFHTMKKGFGFRILKPSEQQNERSLSNHRKTHSGWNTKPSLNTAMNFYQKGTDELSLTGQPLDPYVISTKENRTKGKKVFPKQREGFFNHVAAQFSEASKRHFGDNPTRKIKTSHLKAGRGQIRHESNAYSQILGATGSDLQDITGHMDSVSDSHSDLNKTLNMHQLRLQSNDGSSTKIAELKSDVMAFVQNFKEPSKIVKIVRSLRPKRGSSFFRQIKQQHKNELMTYYVKDKPVYKQAYLGNNLMYCMCKVCGLKHSSAVRSLSTGKNNSGQDQFCQCTKKDLLPFKDLQFDPVTKKVQNNIVINTPDNSKTPIKYKASTIRTLKSEPIHKKHAKMSRRGRPILKFSEFKPKLEQDDQPKLPISPKNLNQSAFGASKRLPENNSQISSSQGYRRLFTGSKNVKRFRVFSKRNKTDSF